MRSGLIKTALIFQALCLLLVIVGCSGSSTSYHIKEDVDFSFIQKVAILPLKNLTGDKNASDAVRQVLMTELLSSGLVDVVVPGDVMSAINNIGILSISSPSIEEIRALGKFLRVEAVILGSVDRFGEVKSGSVSAAEVTVTLMMVDTGAGDILWSVTMTSGGPTFMARHFGTRSPTLSETVSSVLREAVGTLADY